MPRAMAQPMPVGLGARGGAGGCGLWFCAPCWLWPRWPGCCGGSAAGTPSETKGAESSAPPSAAVLERGAYLVRVGACMGCHTAQGGVVLAGGEVRTPFGVFHAPNLTPDAETGLGRWSLADFRRAMRHGVAPAGACCTRIPLRAVHGLAYG
jgi:hypothetical protein